MNIAIDFDGTCVTHAFPDIGKDIGSARVLKALVNRGHNLILFTMRSDVNDPKASAWHSEIILKSGDYLTDAVNWFKENGIELYGIQENPTQKSWTSSPKCYAELYIDDAGLGMPLKKDWNLSHRPFVDWDKVEEILIEKGIL